MPPATAPDEILAATERLIVEHRLMQKPVSLYSKDISDFQYKKYIEISTEYYIESDEGTKPISEAEAIKWVKNHQRPPL